MPRDPALSRCRPRDRVAPVTSRPHFSMTRSLSRPGPGACAGSLPWLACSTVENAILPDEAARRRRAAPAARRRRPRWWSRRCPACPIPPTRPLARPLPAARGPTSRASLAWRDDDLAQFWQVFLRNCKGLMRPDLRQPGPAGARHARAPGSRFALRPSIPPPPPSPRTDAESVQRFLQTYLQPWRRAARRTASRHPTWSPDYYEPLVRGSRARAALNQWPLYTPPKGPADHRPGRDLSRTGRQAGAAASWTASASCPVRHPGRPGQQSPRGARPCWSTSTTCRQLLPAGPGIRPRCC